DPPLEIDSRVRREDGVAVAGRDLVEPIAEDVRLHPTGDERDLRPLVPRDLRRRVQGDRVPHDAGRRLVDAVGAQEVPRRVRRIDLEPVVAAAVLRGEPEGVEYRPEI